MVYETVNPFLILSLNYVLNAFTILLVNNSTINSSFESDFQLQIRVNESERIFKTNKFNCKSIICLMMTLEL